MCAAQQIFDLGVVPNAPNLVITAANQQAVQLLQAPQNWPTPVLWLYGPTGAGKSLLAQLWGQHMQATFLQAADLDRRFWDRAATPYFVLDNAEQILAGNLAAQTAMFHAYQYAVGFGGRLLLVGQSPVASVDGWLLADWQSRLQASLQVGLQPPDDKALAQLYAESFLARQLVVPVAVVDYLVRHHTRAYEAVGQAVAALDALSLAQKSKITVPLVRGWLKTTSF